MLPDGFSIRSATMDDIQGVFDLIATSDIAMIGKSDIDMSDLVESWQESHFDLENGTCVVLAPNGQLVGYEEYQDASHSGRIYMDGFVHPEYVGLGIGTTMLHIAEQRAQGYVKTYPDDVRVSITAGCYGHDERARDLFINEGYKCIRHFFRMKIDMATPPPTAVWPEGISVRTFVVGQDDRATHATVEEAFSDHWGHSPRPFDQWAERMQSEHFDPSLWFLAIDEATGEIAGTSLCRLRMRQAWLNTLAVRRAYRRQGLGTALLLHTFNEFYKQGYRSVGLGVDAQSLTGATALYERAGMVVDLQYATYEKELRAGRTLYTTTL